MYGVAVKPREQARLNISSVVHDQCTNTEPAQIFLLTSDIGESIQPLSTLVLPRKTCHARVNSIYGLICGRDDARNGRFLSWASTRFCRASRFGP